MIHIKFTTNDQATQAPQQLKQPSDSSAPIPHEDLPPLILY